MQPVVISHGCLQLPKYRSRWPLARREKRDRRGVAEAILDGRLSDLRAIAPTMPIYGHLAQSHPNGAGSRLTLSSPSPVSRIATLTVKVLCAIMLSDALPT